MQIKSTIAGCCLGLVLAAASPAAEPAFTASSAQDGFAPGGAADGERFASAAGSAWKGKPVEASWWWQIRFDEPRPIGSILQVVGDDPTILRHAPREYVWQSSLDGQTWDDLEATRVADERRTFRIHRLPEPQTVRHLRMHITAATDEFPAVREVEFFASPTQAVDFPEWIVAVNTEETRELPFECPTFIDLAHNSPGGEHLQAQILSLVWFDDPLLAIEPRPLCAFLTGNLVEWCQRNHESWRGTAGVLSRGNLPIWASCGGAQGLAILSDAGLDRPWDCPHCRDPKNPKLPIYTHIGHTATRLCGDYSGCVFERGPHAILQTARDPVFAGLPREFTAIESHCGQIEYPPAGWTLIATHGAGGRTKTQCLRRDDRYIYAAQFHIEMSGTPESSRAIMANFLRLARAWGGYNPNGNPPAAPDVIR